MLDVVAASPKRRAYAVSSRFALHLSGCAVIAIGVGLMLWNDFGPGPLDVMIGAIRQHSGLPLTFAVWLTTDYKAAELTTPSHLGRDTHDRHHPAATR